MPLATNWMEDTLLDIALKGDIELKQDTLAINNRDELKNKLSQIIAHLIDHNFEKLLWILYRVDVDEEKAKQLLAAHLPEDAPGILADLIIQRQLKKEELKKQFHSHVPADGDEDLKL